MTTCKGALLIVAGLRKERILHSWIEVQNGGEEYILSMTFRTWKSGI